ncbi:ATP-binding protein [Paraconexibacter antarcticus]|uniref:ATP-binding protein n=1 Tax=Paraconexibacter antarcticus TaxID=2949664 RepID=A0ABY5DNL4_9ACTN|nr:ATP-binding protein [Paraconexibacter antarcticus]UTI63040.1 ATP-binding protein [Paraconexibacter antarcticus]
MTDLHLEIRADPAMVAYIRAIAIDWARFLPPPQRRSLVLAISEVVTNSVLYGPVGGTISVHARRYRQGVRVEVRDDGHEVRVAPRRPDDRGGRGLHILTSLASSWGVQVSPTRVWFVIGDEASGPAGP